MSDIHYEPPPVVASFIASEKFYNFIIGPKLETELEVFILPRTALLARIQQHWNPLSIDKWNTVWNVGIKILLY